MNKIILGKTLIIGLLGVTMGLTACSKDEENPVPGKVNGKKISMIKEGDDIITYEYSSDDKIIIEDEDGHKTMYSYSDNQIVRTSSSSSGRSWRYTLSDGRIVMAVESSPSSSSSSYSPSEITYYYKYDNDGHLTSINSSYSYTVPGSSYGMPSSTSEYSYSDNITYTWKDGNMVKSTSESTKTSKETTSGSSPTTSKSTYRTVEVADYTYTEQRNIIPTLPLSKGTLDYILAWQGYYGKSSWNLPKMIVYNITSTSSYSSGPGSTYISTGSYTYDYTIEDGLVTKVIETEKYTSGGSSTSSDTDIDIYSFMWQEK